MRRVETNISSVIVGSAPGPHSKTDTLSQQKKGKMGELVRGIRARPALHHAADSESTV